MAVTESFRGFRRIGFDKTGIAVGQVQGKIVNLPFNTGVSVRSGRGISAGVSIRPGRF